MNRAVAAMAGELAEAARELWAVRRRLLPVVMGLCFGTLGLTILLAFGDGFDRAMREALTRSGDAMLRWSGGTTSLAHDGLPAGRAVPLTPREVALLAAAPEVAAAAAEVQLAGRVVADADEVGRNTTICAVGAGWAAIRGLAVLPGGRFVAARDEQERRRVAVVGGELAQQLWGTTAVVGRTLRVFDAPFLVVGVLDPRPGFMQYGGNDDLKVIVPFATAQAMRGLRQVGYVLTRLRDPAASRAAVRDLRARLGARLRFDAGDLAAVRVVDHAGQAGEISAIVAGTRLFLAILGVLGLLVAAVGVANMMFVMVEERVREIGLCMALGATPRQVAGRQLLETAAVVVVGGGIGLVAAAALTWALSPLPLPDDARVYLGEPLLAPATALVIAGLLGLCAGIAGWRPAVRAAAVAPVEALRHD